MEPAILLLIAPSALGLPHEARIHGTAVAVPILVEGSVAD